MLSRYGPGGNLCYLGNKNAGGGSQGPIGPQGQQGIPGPAGPTGPTGPGGSGSGGVGPVGPAGPAGPTGAQGLQGIPGPVGPAGPTGASGTGGGGGVGPIGPQGPTGAAGTNGAAGAAGPAGRGVSTLSIISGRLNATFTDTGATLFDLGNVIGPVGPAGATGPPGTVATPAVTKIIAGQNITISPTIGTGDVTINSYNAYVFKLSWNNAALSPSSGSPGAITAGMASDGSSITNGVGGWTLTTNAVNSITITPPTALRGRFGNFLRYTQFSDTATGQSTNFKLDAFSVPSTSGSLVGYTASTGGMTFFFGTSPNANTGIVSAGTATMYILMSLINPLNVFI